MNNFRVVTPYGRDAASARVRLYEWLDRIPVRAEILSYAGRTDLRPRTLVRSPVRHAFAEATLRRAARRHADVVLIGRQASPISRGGIESRMLSTAQRGVFDFDDALQWDWRGSAVDVIERPRGVIASLRAADVVIAGNELLGSWASRIAQDVRVIPSCVEPSQYEEKHDYELHQPPIIGWLGSPSTESFLSSLASPLLSLHRACGARLLVVSSGSRDLGPLQVMADRMRWSAGVQRGFGSMCDVAIMPLTDSIMSRGKCGYKLLQYGAAGVPAVASPVGVAADIVAALGFVPASRDREWLDGLTGLLQLSAEERRTAGSAARHETTARYSYEAWLPAWVAAVFGPHALPGLQSQDPGDSGSVPSVDDVTGVG